MLWLIAVLSYYLSSLYKHVFYFQARVEQSVPFHHLPSFSSYYGARPKNKPYRITRWFVNQCPQLGTPKTRNPLVPQAQAGPTHHPPDKGSRSRPNLDSKPPLLSLRLSAMQGPPPSPPPISQSEKSRNPRQESNKSSLCPYPSMCLW